MVPNDRRRADALDRYWDAVQGGHAASRPEEVDELVAAVIARLNERQVPPGLEAAHRRVRRRIIAPAAAKARSTSTMAWHGVEVAAGVPTAPRPSIVRRTPVRHRWGIAHCATAALVLLTVGLVVVGFSAARPDRPTTIPAVAQATLAAATATPVITEESLVEIRLPGDARLRGDAGVATTIPFPQTASTWRSSCCPGPMIEYVAAGTYTVRAEAAIRVVRGDRSVDEVPAGTAVVLGPGDGLISPTTVAVDAANTGTTPVTLLTWNLVADLADDLGANPGRGDGQEQIPTSTGPATLRLRRIDLVADAPFPAAPTGVFQFGVSLPVRNADGTPLLASAATSAGGPLFNRLHQAVTVSVVVLTPAGAAAGSPAPQ